MTRMMEHPVARNRLIAKVALAGVVAAGVMIGSGCNNAGQGALTGAGFGAAGGAILGSMYGHAGKGAAIGAVAGALTGGVIGDQNQRGHTGRTYVREYHYDHHHYYYHQPRHSRQYYYYYGY